MHKHAWRVLRLIIAVLTLLSAGETLTPLTVAQQSAKQESVFSSPAIAQNSSPSKPNTSVVQSAGQSPSRATDQGFFESISTPTSFLVVLALGVFGLLGFRKLRSRRATPEGVDDGTLLEDEWSVEADDEIGSQTTAQQTGLGKPNLSTAANVPGKTRKSTNNMAVATPDSLFGAYRIDQEVGKLVMGQPHRMDVLSSRAPEDRRAIETSLIKIIASSPDEDERRRACEALEEYGFVARECASLLMAPNAFDRTTAARSLGEIKSPAALPFLIEGLYDNESIVRNQAVVSIGQLRVPRAIGALLDIARRHPDVPGSLVSRALSACSLEDLDFFDTEFALLGGGSFDGSVHDIARLEPASSVEDLAEETDDISQAEALAKIEGPDIAQRLEALKSLSAYPVRTSVAALTAAARHDAEPTLRAQAILSLASINHESVFPAVLIGMADESREVRAAAARSLSHLSFDRADAYIRVMGTTDEETLPDVARACIKAGIVAQGIERLASNDRRQVYEAYAVLSLLAKAKMTEPIIEAITSHVNLDIRLTAVRLLANTGQEEIREQFRELTLRRDFCEELRTALLEGMYKLDQARADNPEPAAT